MWPAVPTSWGFCENERGSAYIFIYRVIQFRVSDVSFHWVAQSHIPISWHGLEWSLAHLTPFTDNYYGNVSTLLDSTTYIITL